MSTISVDNFEDLSAAKSIGAEYVTEGTSKAWVSYNQGTPAIRDSFNLSSMTDNGSGHSTANFSNNFNAADYSAQGFCEADGASPNAAYNVTRGNADTYTVSAFMMETRYAHASNTGNITSALLCSDYKGDLA